MAFMAFTKPMYSCTAVSSSSPAGAYGSTLNWIKASKTRSWPKEKVLMPPERLFFILCLGECRVQSAEGVKRGRPETQAEQTGGFLCILLSPVSVEHGDVDNPDLPEGLESFLEDELRGFVMGQPRLILVVHKPDTNCQPCNAWLLDCQTK